MPCNNGAAKPVDLIFTKWKYVSRLFTVICLPLSVPDTDVGHPKAEVKQTYFKSAHLTHTHIPHDYYPREHDNNRNESLMRRSRQRLETEHVFGG